MKPIAKLACLFALPCLVSVASGTIVQVIGGYTATYPKGKIGGSSAQGLPAQYVAIPPAQEYYLDYQVRFENDFEWVKGGKLPGLVGGKHTSGCASIVSDGWSARHMWRGGGRGEVYLYHQNRKSGCGDSYVFPSGGDFKKNEWNRITERVVINAPGQSNGLIETWFNGKKMVTLNNVKLRGNVAADVALIDNVSLQTFYGGSTSSWAPPHDTHATYSSYYVRDDLPDFTRSFEDLYGSTGVIAAVGGSQRGRTSGSVTWLGGSSPFGRWGDLGPKSLVIYDATGARLSAPAHGVLLYRHSAAP